MRERFRLLAPRESFAQLAVQGSGTNLVGMARGGMGYWAGEKCIYWVEDG